MVEAAKLAFADREAWYGDVDDVPVDTLLSAAYAASARGWWVPSPPRASCRARPTGASPPRRGLVGGSHAGRAGGRRTDRLPQGLSPGDTCHVDVVDRWGNRVSATPSGGWLQSSPVVPGLGFALPTRAQMFWLEPGLPTSLVPGKRPRTTLSPALLLDDDGSGVAFGTPGGDQQDQWPVPFLLRHLVGGAGLQAAIDAPAWHSTQVPGIVLPAHPHAERTGRGVTARRRRAGCARRPRARGRGRRTVGARAAQRGRGPADGLLVAAANPRGMQGYAVGAVITSPPMTSRAR